MNIWVIIPIEFVNLFYRIFLISILGFILIISPYAIEDLQLKKDKAIWIIIFSITFIVSIFGLIFI